MEAFIAKLNGTGSALVYSTILGGNGDDSGLGIALACPDPIDSTKCSAVVTGRTISTNFPTKPGVLQTALNGTGTGTSSDALVTKLTPDGSGLSYSTYLGGSGTDAGNGIAFACTTPPASACSAYVTGQSNSPAFPTPTTATVLQANNTDTFVAKVDIGARTTTAVASSANPSVFGQPVTFTATVSSSLGTPTGTVIFDDGTTQLATKTLDASGQATFTATSLSVGSHTITAFYGGDPNFLASTSPIISQAVGKASTRTTVTVMPSTPVFGQSVAFTATVAPTSPGGGTPTGTVTFFDGGAQLGTGPLPLSGGQATLTTAALVVGAHSISVTYGGDANFTGSTGPPSGPLSQTVNPAPTTTALASSVTSTAFGQSVTFTATVRSDVSPAAGPPTGTVTFMNYGVSLGTSTLTSSGQATLTTNALRIGINSITASYNGSTSFLGSTSAASSSGILSQPVISAPTVRSTDRTAQQPAGALYANCKVQFVTITGTGFLPPTAFPPNIGISLTPSTGITTVGLSFISSTTISVQVDVDPDATGSRSITVTNPDTGTGTSAGPILDVGNPNPCPAQGLAPKTTSSGTATPPVISSLVPSSGLRGSSVTVNGSNFGSTPVVTFTGPGNTPVIATINTSTSTSLTVTVPAFPGNTADAFDGPVFVTRDGLASSGVAFTVTNPRLSVVTPASAPPGSVTLDLAGTKLQSGATVQFFNTGTTTPASGVTVTSVTSDGTGQHLSIGLTATATTGLLDAVVTNPGGGNSKLTGAFQVKAPPVAGFTFSVVDSANPSSTDPSSFLPRMDGVQVTLDSTGHCTAKSVTPHAVTLTANFTTTVGWTPPSSVTFTLTSVSNLPGTATNEDCEPGATPTPDFSIGLPNVTSQQVTVSGNGTYQTTLYSYDWGGSVTVSVTGVTNQTVTGIVSLPVDTDGDRLPDAYELNASLNTDAAGQNVLDRLNQDQNGNGIADGDDRFATDGLSNFQKYRGVYLSGPPSGNTGLMSGFTRLGSGLRHLFVRGRGFGSDPAIQAAAGTCGITVGPLGLSDPSTGTPVSDPTLSPANPCPAFQVGAGFFAAGVQVHDVSTSFTTSTTFPRQSLANPVNPILDMSTIAYDGVNCSAYGCSTSKTGARNWSFSTLGFSSYGTASAYGADSRIAKKAVDAYFSDRPYEHRTAGLAPCTSSSTSPCYTLAPDGTTPMLTPLSLIGDFANDNGIRDTTKEVVDANGQLVSDTYASGSFNRQLSAMDATNDSCVELPFVADPRGMPRCSPVADSAASPQATKQQVVRSLITHELGHNVGINTHTTDPTDIMYQTTTNWIREGHFSPTAAGLIQIHNGGLQ